MTESTLNRIRLGNGLHMWTTSAYRDAGRILASPGLCNDYRRAGPEFQRVGLGLDESLRSQLARHMIHRDPPDHERLRRPVAEALSARRMARWRDRIREVVDRLVDGLAPSGTVELVEDFAYPFALTVLCEVLGFPESFRLAYQHDRLFRPGAGPSPYGSPARATHAEKMRRLLHVFEDIIAAKRHQPEDDLISRLVEADGDWLSHDELTSMLFLLLVGGIEPTARYLRDAMITLLDHPDRAAQLRTDPTLINAATTELLRLTSPLARPRSRFAKHPREVCGVSIPPGEPISVDLAGANRDSSRFTQPDRLDFDRDDGAILSFGHGPHYCVGVHLARVECEIAVMTLLERFPNLALAVPRDHIKQQAWPVLRGPDPLPLNF